MVRAMSAHPAPLSAPLAPAGRVRHDWSLAEVEALFALPFMDLILRAQLVHRAHHAANTVQMSTLLSIKTGACPEDCAYCPQSVRYDTGVEREALMERRGGARLRAARQGGRRHALLHGRRLPRAEGEGPGGDRGTWSARCARSASRAAPRSAC